jgi:hypothetical protein
VLGIDNVIFLSILAGKLRPDQQRSGRRLGLAGRVHHAHRAAVQPELARAAHGAAVHIGALRFLEAEAREISGRDLILIGGGLFLIAKATYEIHHKVDASTTLPLIIFFFIYLTVSFYFSNRLFTPYITHSTFIPSILITPQHLFNTLPTILSLNNHSSSFLISLNFSPHLPLQSSTTKTTTS